MQPLVGPLHDDRTPSICRIAEGHLTSREVSFRETSAAQTLPVPIDDVGTTLLLCIILAATTYEASFQPSPKCAGKHSRDCQRPTCNLRLSLQAYAIL